jgi:hypothetical protein
LCVGAESPGLLTSSRMTVVMNEMERLWRSGGCGHVGGMLPLSKGRPNVLALNDQRPCQVSNALMLTGVLVLEAALPGNLPTQQTRGSYSGLPLCTVTCVRWHVLRFRSGRWVVSFPARAGYECAAAVGGVTAGGSACWSNPQARREPRV